MMVWILAEFYKTIKKELILKLLKIFHKIKSEKKCYRNHSTKPGLS
jgi:hypothetical protein